MIGRKPLMPVAEALARLMDGVAPVDMEMVPIADAWNRVLAGDLKALRTQPPFPASAMDGYALRANDAMEERTTLAVIGEAAAGHPFVGDVGSGQCVRIFTGAPVPEGADSILIQEDAISLDGTSIQAKEAVRQGQWVRPAGIDFREGDAIAQTGQILDAGLLSLAAAANHAELPVWRKPKIAILATGDELLAPGSVPGPGQIIASNSYGVAAVARSQGADIIDLGIARDNADDLKSALKHAVDEKADILVTLGGASVGEHDLVREVFVSAGMALDFWKINMRPGKPLMAGNLGPMRILGLPGNPVSSLVCGHLFLAPLTAALAGRDHKLKRINVTLAHDIAANGDREHYMRGVSSAGHGKERLVQILDNQDSSLLATFAKADVLVIRPPHDGPRKAGETIQALEIRPH